MSEFNIRKVTAKKIFIRDDYISLAKSFMSLPIFNATNKHTEDFYLDIEARDIFQYKNVRIKTPLLSLDFDFNILLFLIQTAVIAEDNNQLFIEYSKLFKFLNVSPNNFPAYRAKTIKSYEKLKQFSMQFNKGGREYLLGFVGDVIEIDGGLSVTVSRGLRVFYEADHDLIFNLKVKKFNELNSAFARALYLFYKSNNFKKVNTFKIEDLIYRLQCKETQQKEINRSIRKAHKELLKHELIVFAKEIKNGKRLEKFTIQLAPLTDADKASTTEGELIATPIVTNEVEVNSDESAWLDTSCFSFDSEEDELPF
ncbi:hypothetical protein [Pseudomonas sp. TE3911]